MDVFVLDCGIIYFLFPSPFFIFNPDCVIVQTLQIQFKREQKVLQCVLAYNLVISMCTGEMWWWRAGGCPRNAVRVWQVCTRAGFWSPDLSRFAGTTCDSVRDLTLELSIPEGLHPMERTHMGAELQPVGWTHMGEVSWRTVFCGSDLTLEQRKCEESSLWGRRSDRVWWTDHNPNSLSHCTSHGKEVEKSGVKLTLGRRERWEGKVLSGLDFISHGPSLIWLVIN